MKTQYSNSNQPVVKLCAMAIACLSLALSGCVSTVTGDTYQRGQTGASMEVEIGTVVAIKEVVIDDGPNQGGAAVGAIVGGIAGGQSDGIKGQLGGVLGATLGSVLGNKAGQELSKSKGWEIYVKLENGKTIAVVQEQTDRQSFAPNTQVRVLRGGGKIRVAPL